MPNFGFSDDIYKILYQILRKPYQIKLRQKNADQFILGGASPRLCLVIKIMGFFFEANHYNSKEKFSKSKLYRLFHGNIPDFQKLIKNEGNDEIVEEDLQIARSQVKELLDCSLKEYSNQFEEEQTIMIRRKRKMMVKFTIEKRETIQKIVFDGELARRDKLYKEKVQSPTNESSSPQRIQQIIQRDMNEFLSRIIENDSFQYIRDLQLLSSFHSEENIFSLEGELDDGLKSFGL